MRHAVFVLPFALETTLRFVQGAAAVPGVRLSVVSQDPAEKLPAALRAELTGHWRIDNCFDPRQLALAVQALAGRFGPVERLIGVLEQLQVPLAQARELLGLPGHTATVAQNFRDKARMKDVLRAAGVPCARHRLVERAEEAHAFIAEVGFPVVVKPPAGAGGARTFRLDAPADLQRYLAEYPPATRGVSLFEEFVRGTEHSFDSVLLDGRPVWYSISRYMPSPLEVMENPWIQWCVLLPRHVDGPEYAAIREVAFRALAALGMQTGLSHMEWFRRADGSVAVSEVGARPPGAQFTTLLSYAHDLDFYRAWPRLMIFNEFDPPPRVYAAGAAYVRGQGRGRVKQIRGLEEARRELGHLVVEAKLPRAEQTPSTSYEGDGYLIVRHPQTEVVEAALKRIVSLIRVELG
jgi:phosphoribosylaminoimidazole carboxylase (NCAIR synthetase)